MRLTACRSPPTSPTPSPSSCSDQARSITGILLPIDAGWLAAVSYRTYAGGVPWKE